MRCAALGESPPLVRVRAVQKIHAPGSPTEVRALDGVTFDIARGEYLAIVGESGSGKTTLMHLLGALDRPTHGDVEIDGVTLARATRRGLAAIRSAKVGFVFQGFNLIASLDALENVMLAARYAGVAPATARREARARLADLGLSDRTHHRPSQLSGGQQQRVAIARALVNAPALLLADEPTGELDTKTAAHVLDAFDGLQRAGQTIVVVTHAESVWRRAQRVIHLRDGRIDRIEERVAASR